MTNGVFLDFHSQIRFATWVETDQGSTTCIKNWINVVYLNNISTKPFNDLYPFDVVIFCKKNNVCMFSKFMSKPYYFRLQTIIS